MILRESTHAQRLIRGYVLRWPRKVKGRRQYPVGLLELSKRIIIHLFLSSHNRVELVRPGISRGKKFLRDEITLPLLAQARTLSNINFVCSSKVEKIFEFSIK